MTQRPRSHRNQLVMAGLTLTAALLLVFIHSKLREEAIVFRVDYQLTRLGFSGFSNNEILLARIPHQNSERKAQVRQGRGLRRRRAAQAYFTYVEQRKRDESRELVAIAPCSRNFGDGSGPQAIRYRPAEETLPFLKTYKLDDFKRIFPKSVFRPIPPKHYSRTGRSKRTLLAHQCYWLDYYVVLFNKNGELVNIGNPAGGVSGDGYLSVW